MSFNSNIPLLFRLDLSECRRLQQWGLREHTTFPAAMAKHSFTSRKLSDTWERLNVNPGSLFVNYAHAELIPSSPVLNTYVRYRSQFWRLKISLSAVSLLADGSWKWHRRKFILRRSKANNMENVTETRFYKTTTQTTLQLVLVWTAGLVGEHDSSPRHFQSYCGPASSFSFSGCAAYNNLTKSFRCRHQF